MLISPLQTCLFRPYGQILFTPTEMFVFLLRTCLFRPYGYFCLTLTDMLISPLQTSLFRPYGHVQTGRYCEVEITACLTQDWSGSSQGVHSDIKLTAHCVLQGHNYTMKKTWLSCDAFPFEESSASPDHNGKNCFLPRRVEGQAKKLFSAAPSLGCANFGLMCKH